MTKTNFGLVDWAKKWLGMPYWYGCVCYKCTQDLLTRKTRQYPKHYTSNRTARYKADIAGGKWASDCIGLAKGYMWWDSTKGGVRYAVNGCPDMSANGMLEKATVKGDIKNLPETPGIMLWMDGHAGVYIGGGWAIEERGFNYGCVKTKVADRPWKKWYRLPGLTYLEVDDGEGRENVPFKVENAEHDAIAKVRITGNSVNIRNAPGTESSIVAVLNKGAEIEAVDTSGWRAVKLGGVVCWVSEKYSEVI